MVNSRKISFDNLYKVVICWIVMRWTVIILVGIFLFSFAGATIPRDCDEDMVAYWQFENNVLDSYGSHDGGSWSGDSAYDTFQVGDGAVFIGGSVVSIPDADDLKFSSSFTIEMWVKSDDSPTAVLFEKGNYEIEWVKINPLFGQINASVGNVVLNSASVSSTDAHHIALVWAASSSKLMLYVDEVVVEGNMTSLGAAGADAAGVLKIGEGFKGLVDEVAVYNNYLSTDEIASHRLLSSAGKNYCDLSGVGGGSSTRSDFNVKGCSFDFNGGEIGVSRGQCSRGDADGLFYCDADGNNWTTGEAGLGCSLGADSYDGGNDFCCPPGMFCNQTGTNSFKCARRDVNCFDLDQVACVAASCYWFDGKCSDGSRDYGCDYYGDSNDCDSDRFNFSRTGVGAEMCGTTIECDGETFSVPVDRCGCQWVDDAAEGSKCQIKLVATQMFFGTDSTPNSFSCSSSYTLGECVDGKQNVDRDATVSEEAWLDVLFSNDPDDYDACVEALGCLDDNSDRSCGEPLIKLPGFSLFAFFVSLFLIGMYYYFRGDVDE